MKTIAISWAPGTGWCRDGDPADAGLVIYFAAPSALAAEDVFAGLTALCPRARVVGCSTGGEIAGLEVTDDSVAAVAVTFDKASVELACLPIAGPAGSREAGVKLAAMLPADGLRGVFVFADGMRTNGTALVSGLREVLPGSVLLTGGLAGDGADFKRTLVGCDGPPREGLVAAIGFYGDGLRLGWGSIGGWERFGPERLINRSVDNVLYELDGEPALDLYKRYLGDEAANLPGSALLFPLTVRRADETINAVVRTIVGIDEPTRGLIFAGDVPQGYVAQLMRGHFDSLIKGASRAGERARQAGPHQLALLVSCIGRKLLMGQRVADEIEAAVGSLGPGVRAIGYYSYGEIAPHGDSGRCELHNQTMTITTIGEG
ncbi:MAG TPA: hypothetical protein HPQ04_02120 [Rhodospirillaceae bacterium]|nr:hypothetical protein [Rhodospirillaceae bacterium]